MIVTLSSITTPSLTRAKPARCDKCFSHLSAEVEKCQISSCGSDFVRKQTASDSFGRASPRNLIGRPISKMGIATGMKSPSGLRAKPVMCFPNCCN